MTSSNLYIHVEGHTQADLHNTRWSRDTPTSGHALQPTLRPHPVCVCEWLRVTHTLDAGWVNMKAEHTYMSISVSCAHHKTYGTQCQHESCKYKHHALCPHLSVRLPQHTPTLQINDNCANITHYDVLKSPNLSTSAFSTKMVVSTVRTLVRSIHLCIQY